MIVFYDEECNLCRRFKQALEILDKNNLYTFRSIYDDSIYSEFPQLKKEDCEEDVHMIHNGKIFRGSEVIEEIIKNIPGVKKIAWLLDKDSAKTAMDAFYGQISEMRAMQRKKCFRCGTKSQKRRIEKYRGNEL